jgi:DNA recombination protein RmuC
MFAEGVERISAAAFKIDLRKHIDDIANKYIIPGETSAGAILFLPAEAVFAEIHARHRDLVDYAQKKCVWLTSPTTLMAVLTTAQAVIRSVETRKQIHIIKDELHKLGADFGRFQSRMDNLAKHIEQAKNDVDDVHVSSRKISERFARIERVELEASDQPKLRAVDGAAEK